MAEYNATQDDFPTMNTEVYGTTYHVVVNASHLDESDNCVDTPAVTLSGFAWRVRICKKMPITNSEGLDLFLIADITDPGWSIDAKAILNIRRAGEHVSYFQNSLDWKTFSADTPSHAVLNYLMSTSFQTYLSDGKYRFNFEIVTTPAKLIEVEEDMFTSASNIRLLVNNVASLTNETTARSAEVNLKGIRWYVVAKQLDEFLTISVHANPHDLSAEWTIKAKITVKILPANRVDRNVQPLMATHEKEYFRDLSHHNFTMLQWAQAIRPDGDYVIKNKAAFLVDIRVYSKERIVLFKF